MCAWHVRNKPETRKKNPKLGNKKSYKTKEIYHKKSGRVKIKKLRVKLYTEIILNLKIRLVTHVKRNTLNKSHGEKGDPSHEALKY